MGRFYQEKSGTDGLGTLYPDGVLLQGKSGVPVKSKKEDNLDYCTGIKDLLFFIHIFIQIHYFTVIENRIKELTLYHVTKTISHQISVSSGFYLPCGTIKCAGNGN